MNLADLDLFLSVSSKTRRPRTIPNRLIIITVLAASSICHGIADHLNIQDSADDDLEPMQALSNLAQQNVRVTKIAITQNPSQAF